MKFNPIKSIIRSSVKKPGEKINILTAVAHSPFESEFCRGNVEVYGMREGNTLDWNYCRPVPSNYHILPRDKGDDAIPDNVDFDVVVSQNTEAHYPFLSRYAQLLNIPLIQIYHTTPPIWQHNWQQYVHWSKQTFIADHNVFITEFSRDVWGFKENEATVIYHAADTENFRPLDMERSDIVMYTCNMLRERDYACGYQLWETISSKFNRELVGKDNNPKLSNVVDDPKQLNEKLNKCGVYLNCSLYSPFPMSLLEAATAGSPIVSTATCEIPVVFKHGHDAMLFPPDRPDLGEKYVRQLLDDRELAERIGRNAHETALRFFNPENFVAKWDKVLNDQLR